MVTWEGLSRDEWKLSLWVPLGQGARRIVQALEPEVDSPSAE